MIRSLRDAWVQLVAVALLFVAAVELHQGDPAVAMGLAAGAGLLCYTVRRCDHLEHLIRERSQS